MYCGYNVATDDIVCNLQVIKVTVLDGPTPAPVWAFSFNTYTVSGDNPSIVYISTMLLMLTVLVPSSWIE